MTRHIFFTAMLVALFSTVAFAQYIITGNPTDGFTAKNGTTTVGEADQPIGTVIEAIRVDVDDADVSIQFGDGENVLDIGTASAYFYNYNSSTWGKITLSGKITSSGSSTISLSSVSIESTADITADYVSGGGGGVRAINVGIGSTVNISGGSVSGYYSDVIYNNFGTVNITGGTVSSSGRTIYSSGGTVNITGGTVSTTSGSSEVISGGKITVSGNATITAAIYRIDNFVRGTISGSEIEILGGTVSNTGTEGYAVYSTNSLVLGGSPKITGNISVPAGKLRTNNFAPGTEYYYIMLAGTVATGDVAVVSGASYIDNFKLTNPGWGLEVNGGNLVTKEIPIYTVTFLDQDGKVLKTESVNEGLSANPPTKVGYTLIGWDIDFSNVTSDLTVTGSYIINTYTVTFLDWDGEVLKTELVKHGSAATAPTPTRESYALIGWDKAFSNVTSDLTVTAKYIATYTVIFLGWGGTVLKTEIVNEGDVATFYGSLSKEGYTFTGWDRDIGYSVLHDNNHYFNDITSNLTITAKYTINTFVVKFLDWDDTELKTEIVEYDSPATAPTAPSRDGYVFTDWSFYRVGLTNNLNNIRSDLTVTAVYGHTVTFVDWDGMVLKTDTVPHGGSSYYYPEGEGRTGYTFTGWDKAFSNVTSNLTVTAEYAINTYTVTFADWDDTELETQTVEHGSSATAPEDPTRAGYTFIGWDIEFEDVTSDLTVTAEYEEITPILSLQIAKSNLLTPTQNGITLTANTNATIAVYNLSGKLISQQNYNAGNHSISLGHLPKGVYIIQARFGSKGVARNAPTQTTRLTVR